MDKNLKNIYSRMTKKEARREVILLKKEFKKAYKEVIKIEASLEYLSHKI